MSDTKFTKGPWKENKTFTTALVIGGDQDVCEVDCTTGLTDTYETYRYPTEEEQANADLIASAPDMYRLLEKCEKTFAMLYPSEIKHVQPEHYSEFKAVHHLIGSIQNELSKARGE